MSETDCRLSSGHRYIEGVCQWCGAEKHSRDYKHEFETLQHAIVGDTGLSAILEASKHMKMRKALERIASCQSYHPGDVVDIARRALS